MPDESTYRSYVGAQRAMADYADYQRRYSETMRESDKVLIQLVRDAAESLGGPAGLRLLDVGCSTGNLLLHLGRLVPGLRMTGVDLAEEVIAACRADPALAGIRFEVRDMLSMEPGGLEPFDLVIANAALMFFTEAELDAAIRKTTGSIKPGGRFLCFDLFHPFQQEIAVVEKSKHHPDGLQFYFRSYDLVRGCLERAGMTDPVFTPFDLPIDLPHPGDSEVTTYTRRDAAGFGMSFRGTLFQPWCHLVATRTG